MRFQKTYLMSLILPLVLGGCGMNSIEKKIGTKFS